MLGWSTHFLRGKDVDRVSWLEIAGLDLLSVRWGWY